MYEIMIGVRVTLRDSNGFIADPQTVYAIEDTIRTALFYSETFQNAVAFSLSQERWARGIRYSHDLTHVNYRNHYTMRNSGDNRRINQLTLPDIFNSNPETVPLIPNPALVKEDARDPDFYINLAIAPNHSSQYYPIWQFSVIHEIIHAITDAGDPIANENRLGPTEILTIAVSRELGWNVRVFSNYHEEERTLLFDNCFYYALREAISRHYHRAYELIQRLFEINRAISSVNFEGLDTQGSDDSSMEGDRDDDEPHSWGSFFLPGSYAMHSDRKKDIFATRYQNIIFERELPLTQWLINKYSLVIAQKALYRAEYGGGFYKKKYKSWKDWYKSSKWKTLLGVGIYDYGFSEAEGYFIYSPYGEIFEDGSFAVGITGTDVKKWGNNDNWTQLAGDNWSYDYAGQMYFDKEGRPVAIVITNSVAGFFGSGWSFIYRRAKWEYESKDDWDDRRFAGRTESLDPHAPRFLIKNK